MWRRGCIGDKLVDMYVDNTVHGNRLERREAVNIYRLDGDVGRGRSLHY